jgi:hypothetical protein
VNEEQAHAALNQQIGGIFLAASLLVIELNRPGMTIERLKASPEAQTFNQSVLRFRRWMDDGGKVYARFAPTKEREELEYWKAQIDGAMAGHVSADERRELAKF